jgi:sigma-B regulation protein RsbU (phosphoserine phosphatase)
MSASTGASLFGDYLTLFAETEIFIFVFMEIVTKLDFVKRVFFQKSTKRDTIWFIILFGLFSIFGTYIGTQQSLGVITNLRDLAPIVAGLVGGPGVGLAVGLIGGIHRAVLGGATCIPCSMATILAGLLAGLVFRLNKNTMLPIIPAMLFALGIEFLHGALSLLLVSPFSTALDIVLANTPQMAIAISLGVGISTIIFYDIRESTGG